MEVCKIRALMSVDPLASITGAGFFSQPDLSNHICTSGDSSDQHLYLETARKLKE